jgi:hypothetical protein
MTEKKENLIQIQFFDRIKDTLPVSMSLVNEIAEALEISIDSAYRRLRAETPLTIDEISILCQHFKIGFDIFAGQSGTVSFHFEQMSGIEGFKRYLLELRNSLISLSKSENTELYYAAIDIPIFHHFNYSELSAFKMFYWMKDVLNEPTLDSKKFEHGMISDELLILGNQIYEAYCNVPSIEIWTHATTTSSIAQIEFYFESGIIEKKENALLLCNQLEEEIKTIQKQAELSCKLMTENSETFENYKLYFSEIEIGNNCILTKKADIKNVYLSFHTFNKLATDNNRFCDDTFKWLNNLLKKSTIISGVSEKQRYMFFKQIFEKINKLKMRIELTE